MENDLSAEELSTPVTITRGELNQLSHAFNNYQAMAEQVQSLATQIAQLRLLTATSARTPEPGSIWVAAPSQVPKVLQLDPFTGDRLELDTYLTRRQHIFLTQPSLFLTEQYKVLYAASYLKDNAYSWVKPLVQEYAKGASVPIEFTSFQKYSESLTRMYADPAIVKSKTQKSTPSTKQVQFPPMPLSSVASKSTLPGMIKPSSTDSMKDSMGMSKMV